MFQQLADQPDKLAAVIQSDPVLQHAAAANPDVARLLDPTTMQQALEVLMQPSVENASASSFQLPRKALMQLQNYAMQLQHHTAAANVQQQKPGAGKQDMWPGQTDTTATDQQSAVVSEQQPQMWAALQQRLNKLQHRSQAFGAAGVLPFSGQQQHLQQLVPTAQLPAVPQRRSPQQLQPPRTLETLVESPLAAGSAAATGHIIDTAAQDQDTTNRVSDGSSTMHELLAAFPEMLGPADDSPLCSSHATIGLMSAVQPAAPTAGSLQVHSMPNPQQLFLSSAATVASPFSPDWQLQQQQNRPASTGDGSMADTRKATGRSVWPLSGSDPAVSSAATAAVAAVPMRPSSALGHRILRPHSSSPIPLGSGSTPLGITQLGSGELVVEITPPTKVTTEISWSVDPDASYVLDASTSGSVGGPPAVLGATLASSSAQRSSSTNLDGFDSGVLARSSSGGPAGYMGVVLSKDPRVDAAVSVPPSGVAGADAKARNSRVSSSTGSTTKGPRRSRQQAAAAGMAISSPGKAAPPKSPARIPAAASQESGQQLQATIVCQPQQQEAAASVVSHSIGREWPGLPVSYGPHTISSHPCSDSAMAPAGYSSHGVKAMLSPRSYYEDVAPSTWRPSDASEYPGDYLELYR